MKKKLYIVGKKSRMYLMATCQKMKGSNVKTNKGGCIERKPGKVTPF